MNRLEQLTILLTLKDRENFTYRWLKYMEQEKCPFHIYIADGGSNDHVSKHINENYINSNLKITYVKTEFDYSLELYYKKVKEAFCMINTPYVIRADNDDFYSILALEKAVDFLNKHDEYSSCGGDIVHFSLKNDNLYGDYDKVNFAEKKDYSDPVTINRMVDFLSKNSGVHYNVNRTAVVRDAWKKIVEHHYQNIRFTELLAELYIVSSGMVHYLDEVYYFRQNGFNIGNSAGLSHNFLDEIVQSNWSSDVNKVFNSVIEYSNLKSKNSKNILLESYKKTLINPFINGLKGSNSLRRLMLKKIIKGIYIYKTAIQGKNFFMGKINPFLPKNLNMTKLRKNDKALLNRLGDFLSEK